MPVHFEEERNISPRRHRPLCRTMIMFRVLAPCGSELCVLLEFRRSLLFPFLRSKRAGTESVTGFISMRYFGPTGEKETCLVSGPIGAMNWGL